MGRTDFTIYDILKGEHQAAETEAFELASQLTDLMTQLRSVEAERDALIIERNKNSGQIATLQAQIDALSAQVQAGLTEIARLNAEIVRLTGTGGGGGGTTTPPTPGAYKVHPAAEQPAKTWKRTIYVDPAKGDNATGDGSQAKPFKSLGYGEASSKKILPGDHIIMMPGDHTTEVSFYGPYGSPNLMNSAEWVWLDYQAGSTQAGLNLRQVKRFLVTNCALKGKGINASGCEHLVFDGTTMTGINKDAQVITFDEWMKAPSFFGCGTSRYVALTNSKVKNIRDGIAVSWSQSPIKAPANSAFALVENNEILGASGDFSRFLASDVIFRNNRFLGGYASGAQGDGNHDDAAQGFALPAPQAMKDAAGVKLTPVQIDQTKPYQIISNILIEGNTFIDRVVPNQANWSSYQGLNIFDGVYENVTVRKNVVVGGAYHGISLYGIQGGVIENNIVLSSELAGGASFDKYWIDTPNSKIGIPSANVTVRNNIANRINAKPGWVVNTGNVPMTAAQAASEFVAFDPANGKYDFHFKPTSQYANKGLGVY